MASSGDVPLPFAAIYGRESASELAADDVCGIQPVLFALRACPLMQPFSLICVVITCSKHLLDMLLASSPCSLCSSSFSGFMHRSAHNLVE